jgi:putative lipoic acid-binding regulatory protein
MILMEASSSSTDSVSIGWTKKKSGASPTTHEWTMGLDGTNDKLHIAGGNDLDTKVVTITEEANTSGTGRVGILDTTPSYPLQVAGYDGSNITIYAQRDIAAYSDVRSKTDILTISGSLDTIGNIRGVTYRNIGDDGFGTGSKMMGVIAQELEPYLPEIVSTDGDGYKSVKYGNLTALLIQAVKEQQEQIEVLKEEIKEIKDG